MYAKIFASMYDGTIVDCGWEAVVTFQQFLILADQDGIVDMTDEALSRRTTIPVDILRKGIALLCLPDSKSRSPTAEGRRLMLIDPVRPWGWQVVNYAHYREIRTSDQRREYMRQYMSDKRAASKLAVSSVNTVLPELVVLAPQAHMQAQAQAASSEAEAQEPCISVLTEPHSGKPERDTPASRVFDHWRSCHGHTRAVLDTKRRALVNARLKDYSEADLCQAISGYLNSPHHMGQNDTSTRYDAIDLLLRDAKHVDMGLGFQRAPVNKPRIRDSANDVQPDLSNEAWRRQMAALGVDPDQLPQHQPNREHQP